VMLPAESRCDFHTAHLGFAAEVAGETGRGDWLRAALLETIASALSSSFDFGVMRVRSAAVAAGLTEWTLLMKWCRTDFIDNGCGALSRC